MTMAETIANSYELPWMAMVNNAEASSLLDVARNFVDYGIHGERFPLGWNSFPPRASREAVRNLADNFIETNKTECLICLKKFKVKGKAKQMPCSHLFHKICIVTWLNQTNSCPVCRYELPTDYEGYEAFRREKLKAEKRKKDIEELHKIMYT